MAGSSAAHLSAATGGQRAPHAEPLQVCNPPVEMRSQRIGATQIRRLPA